VKVVDPGHWYKLTNLDSGVVLTSDLVFVKRNIPPEKYPGNKNAWAGTTIQEVCRALIDRCQYVNNQIRCGETEACITYLRRVILELETRAAKRHNRRIFVRLDIENEPTCKLCGHIQCNETCREKPSGMAIPDTAERHED